MKDLLLYVADADAQAFMNSLLNKPLALGIREITFDIERHPQRDSGMVQSGSELTRMKKGKYQKALLTWDHHGSGRDHKQSPEQVRDEIQNKLDSYTWSENSSITIFVPELEQWLWYCENALVSYCGTSAEQLNVWLADRAGKLGKPVDVLKAEQPKELFEYVMRERFKRTISPRDFAEIGKLAGVNGLMDCETFRSVVDVLRAWFPR
ncbi:hypothetical protein F2Q65_07760 [Thiohalocapsa marina]|uniref:DUF4276 family protein n=1 Tax=Thiohalocapsa marina TaxID=424902 RepID=A0A5M8FN22_9GAMM|nr:hypothetical protein [Thiohalocapsa marina]KAA6185874.1 hypothetical protein F2Q65_07760 [Thiohalocapsa marina]